MFEPRCGKGALRSLGTFNTPREAAAAYARGTTAKATFYSACPRNNQRLQGTFLAVERNTTTGWATVAVDGDWETRCYWRRHHTLAAVSYADVWWTVPQDAVPGTYRLRHFATRKQAITGKKIDFEGVSQAFQVTAAAA